MSSKMILISLDAALSRVALTEYKSLESSKYHENICQWHMEGGWRHKKYKNRKIIEYVVVCLAFKDLHLKRYFL